MQLKNRLTGRMFSFSNLEAPVMPIVADPEQLAVIAGALHAYRKSKNVDPGSELYERAAQRVICL